MNALIYNTKTFQIVRHYKTLAAAKTALTRAQRSGSMTKRTSFGTGRMKPEEVAQLAATTVEDFYDNIDGPVVVKSLMSGAEVTIRKSERGGCTDPSTERYWSM